MTKILFLDVDGVLNGMYTKDRILGCPGVDDRKVRLVAWIVKKTGARIVLTSTWKDQWLSYRSGEDDPFGRRLDQALNDAGLSVEGVTADQMDDRGKGIRAYLYAHGLSGAPFAVLDDTVFSDFDRYQILPHLVKTDYRRGLTALGAVRAVHLLNRRTEDR